MPPWPSLYHRLLGPDSHLTFWLLWLQPKSHGDHLNPAVSEVFRDFEVHLEDFILFLLFKVPLFDRHFHHPLLTPPWTPLDKALGRPCWRPHVQSGSGLPSLNYLFFWANPINWHLNQHPPCVEHLVLTLKVQKVSLLPAKLCLPATFFRLLLFSSSWVG